MAKDDPKQFSVVVPAGIHGLLKIETAGKGHKPYYAVSAALAAWTGRCSICCEELPEGLTKEDDYLMRCEDCREEGLKPDRTRARS